MYIMCIDCCCLLCMMVVLVTAILVIFFFKQNTAYEMRISDWSSDVCSSDLPWSQAQAERALAGRGGFGRADDHPVAFLQPSADDLGPRRVVQSDGERKSVV